MRYSIHFILNLTLCICYSAQNNCTKDSECDGLNYSFATGICLPTRESTNSGICSCIYPCFQIDLLTNRCRLRNCYEIRNITNYGNNVCIPRNQSQLNILHVVFSIFLFSFGIDQFIFNRWILGIIQIILGLWLLLSYLVNLLYYFNSKPYPDPWHSERRYKYFCLLCCCQHSFLTIIYSIWFCIDVILISKNYDFNHLQCA